MMGSRITLFLLLSFIHVCVITALTDSTDLTGLNALKDIWENVPPTWVGADPCESKWDGIACTKSRVTSITLPSIGLKGTLTGDISVFTELLVLDLSYNKDLKGSLPSSIGDLSKLTNLILVGCGFTGPIPPTIGSLSQLKFLSLNSNSFTGTIPPSIGNLSNLYWLDLADNQIEGGIPVSPGLDTLVRTKHFHFGLNKLTGPIPDQLFHPEMKVIHLLFESNGLNGRIPYTLGLVQTLEVVRFDNNSLTGPLPPNLNNLTFVNEMILSNNRFSGPIPNLTGMTILNYLDISNNTFTASPFPSWLSTLQSLTTIFMEGINLEGPVPVDVFSLAHLQNIGLKNNQLNGTFDLGASPSSDLKIVDLQKNQIGDVTPRSAANQPEVILVQNPVCFETGSKQQTYCSISHTSPSYVTPPNNCGPSTCINGQISSPNCVCSYPFTGLLQFRAPLFSNLGNATVYETLQKSLMDSFESNQLPVDSVSLSNSTRGVTYLEMKLAIFPSGDIRFTRSTIAGIAFLLSNQIFKPDPKIFGPFVFHGSVYMRFADPPLGSPKSSSTAIIIGASAGAAVLLLLLALAGIYAYRQKKRAEKATEQNNPFENAGRWDSTKSSGSVPQLKGARAFSFDELKKYTSNFSDAHDVGSGGYGKVYRGTLPTGQLIAIKRAQQGSMQGRMEFKTEIELLSRVHHKNVVSLLGFCFERDEQMLIYEFVPNGSLKDSLSGKTGIRLDWVRRLRITLGAARGLSYLHELANPPIIHRDIKSTNILLDEHLNAKVADFGLSKLMGDAEKDHVTTQVKGTMGYLDPEYYMTQQLTEKSDVYSFGVMMMELLTGRKPIERGKYIVRELRTALDRSKDLHNLKELLDPTMGLDSTIKGVDRYVDLSLKCVREAGADRPSMSEVVKEIENILQLAGLNPNADSASSSASYTEVSKGSATHPYGGNNKDEFGYSGAFPASKIKPQ